MALDDTHLTPLTDPLEGFGRAGTQNESLDFYLGHPGSHTNMASPFQVGNYHYHFYSYYSHSYVYFY
jgi:hypothetical protein